MKINLSLRLPESEYFPEPQVKGQIFLHHTVSSRAKGVLDWWMQDRGTTKVATAYIVDVDGTVYEVFPPECWAWHLGLKTADNVIANKRSIGIEIVSEGAIKKLTDGTYTWQFGKYGGVPLKLDRPWRGEEYFDPYDERQVDSVIQLVNHLCEQHSIPRALLGGDRNRFDPSLTRFRGILAHCNVRADKTDVHPGFPWDRLENDLLNVGSVIGRV